MELRVHLKVCEACGCLWFRAQAETTVYCSACSERFKDFPTAVGRKRRGRPKKTTLPTVFAVEDACPSLEEQSLQPGGESRPILALGGDRAILSMVAAQATQGGFRSVSAGAL